MTVKFRYLFAKNYCKNKIVLDIGSEFGYGCKIISQVAKLVIGIDKKSNYVRFAKKRFSNDNLHFIVMDANYLGFIHNSFDIIISYGAFKLENKNILTEIKNILKKDGAFITFFHNPLYNLNKNSNEYLIKIISNLNPYFDGIEIFGVNKNNNKFNIERINKNNSCKFISFFLLLKK